MMFTQHFNHLEIAATYGRLVAADPGANVRPIIMPDSPPAETAFWVAWNRGDGRRGYMNRRKRRWLNGRLN